MNKLNSKGQSLAMFIIFIPFFIMIGAYIIDLGFAKYNSNKLDSINKLVIKYGLLNIDEEPKEEMIKLIYKNDSKIDRYNIAINESENTVRVELEKSTKGFFGSIIDKEIYKEISSYTGSIKNNNIVIERNW